MVYEGWANLRPQATVAFDSSKVDALVDGLLTMLAEAKNIRHLQPTDCLIVTIAGLDDAGKPVRLTLKATKADIDQFADGKLKPDEFRKKVARNIG